VIRLVVVNCDPIIGAYRIRQGWGLGIDERRAIHVNLDFVQQPRRKSVLQSNIVAGRVVNGLDQVIGKRTAAIGAADQADITVSAAV
jgi:hypothetical protein